MGARRGDPTGAWPRYLASGHLLFTRDGAVWAVAFDEERLEIRGEPSPVLDDVDVATSGVARLAVANDGTAVCPVALRVRQLLAPAPLPGRAPPGGRH
jgi:hypothetical protein